MAAARVLLVDDELVVLDVLCQMLSQSGYTVLPASDPRQALEIARRNRPIAVLLTDVMMPGMSGIELVREIAAISPQTVPVLMTGGAVDAAEVPAGVRLIRKPIMLNKLLAEMQEALAQSVKMKEHLDRALGEQGRFGPKLEKSISHSAETGRRIRKARKP